MPGFGSLGELALGEIKITAPPVATVYAPFSSSVVRPAKKAAIAIIATSFLGFIPPPAQAALSFQPISIPKPKKSVPQPWNWLFPPLQQAPRVFPNFVAPQKVQKEVQQGFTGFAQAFPAQGYTFGQFAWISPVRPSTLKGQWVGSGLLPAPAQFAGFARFSDSWKPRTSVACLFSTFTFSPNFIPKDTHDIVFVDHRKKRKKKRDFVLDELEIKRKRREAIELAFYGPPVEYSLPDLVLPESPKAPPDVGALAQIMAARQIEERNHKRTKEAQDDEDDFENLLKDFL